MKIEIKRAIQSDIPLMQRLFYQTVTFFGPGVFSRSEIEIYSKLSTDKEYWVKKIQEDYVYHAKLNGEILGSFALDRNGNIEYIFVHLNFHGSGIASKLYKKLEEVAIEKGIKTLSIKLNHMTLPFFEKKGFEIISKSVKVVGGEDKLYHSGVKKI